MARILFVCLGNICRSPTAEGVMRQLASVTGLGASIVVDSAGTARWHVGEAPDPRAQEEARRRGIDLSHLRGRQVATGDFAAFELLLAMDHDNAATLRGVAPDDAARAKIRLLREFDPAAVAAGDLEVPDPYYGGSDGFARVFDVIEEACRGLLEHLGAPSPETDR